MRLRSIATIGPAGEGLSDALHSAADAVLLTLATNARPVGALRNTAIEALHRVNEAEKTALVMVNHPRTGLLRDDLDAIVSHNLNGVLLSHTVEPQDVRDAAVALREFELHRDIEPGDIALFPVIDTARGLLRAGEIINAAPRVGGLVFAAKTFAADIGARHEEQGSHLAYARGKVVAAARAYDRLPLIAASPLELLDLAQQGFAGAILPDASAAGAANNAFAPTPAAIARAERHIALYEAARAEGAIVARDAGELVDAHAYRKAQQAKE